MRRNAKVDSNHAAIVKALREAGCSVQSLATVGRGVPDLLIGKDGRNWLAEVKDGSKPSSARRLTADEVRWHEAWRGQVAVVENEADALRLIEEDRG